MSHANVIPSPIIFIRTLLTGAHEYEYTPSNPIARNESPSTFLVKTVNMIYGFQGMAIFKTGATL